MVLIDQWDSQLHLMLFLRWRSALNLILSDKLLDWIVEIDQTLLIKPKQIILQKEATKTLELTLCHLSTTKWLRSPSDQIPRAKLRIKFKLGRKVLLELLLPVILSAVLRWAINVQLRLIYKALVTLTRPHKFGSQSG